MIVAVGSWALRRLTRCKVADLDLIASPDEREGLVARSSRVVSDSASRTVTVNGGRRVEVEWALGFVGREDCRDSEEEWRRLSALASSKGYEILSHQGNLAVVRLPP